MVKHKYFSNLTAFFHPLTPFPTHLIVTTPMETIHQIKWGKMELDRLCLMDKINPSYGMSFFEAFGCHK